MYGKFVNMPIINHVIDHVFLPTKLPQGGEVNEHGKDVAMLTLFCETIEKFRGSSLAEYIPLGSVVWEMARGIAKLHRKGYLDHQVLTEIFNHMS